MSTPTPRTDDHECNAFIGRQEMDSGDVQSAYDFARELERELEEAREDANKAGAVVSIHMLESRRLFEELNTHKAALEMAWDVLTRGNEPMGSPEEYDEFRRDWKEALAAIAKLKPQCPPSQQPSSTSTSTTPTP